MTFMLQTFASSVWSLYYGHNCICLTGLNWLQNILSHPSTKESPNDTSTASDVWTHVYLHTGMCFETICQISVPEVMCQSKQKCPSHGFPWQTLEPECATIRPYSLSQSEKRISCNVCLSWEPVRSSVIGTQVDKIYIPSNTYMAWFIPTD